MPPALPQDLSLRFSAETAHVGGEGTSFVVRERDDGDPLLLKILAPGADLHEAGLLTSLRHPRIPRVLEVGRTQGNEAYLLRELAPGTTLAAWPRPSDDQAVEICAGLLEVLAFVHLRGILHLDLKPANILVEDRDGRPETWVVDFGFGHRTAVGGIRGGTPFFAPPELWLGLTPSPQSDLFSLGASLVAVLRPDVSKRLGDFLRRFPGEDFLTAAGLAPSDLPAPLDRIIPRLVAHRPSERFADAHEALEALRGRGTGRPSSALLALDPVRAHATAVEAGLAGLPVGVDLEVRGADAADRETVALHVSCRLGDVKELARGDEAVRLHRGGDGTAATIVLPALDDRALAEHLGAALGLDEATAATTARTLQEDGGTLSASAATACLIRLADAGRIVPDGAGWAWPDALTGRLDLSPAEVPTTPDELRALAARGQIEPALAAFGPRAQGDDEAAWRHALAEGLLAAGEPLRVLPLAHDLAVVRARALLDIGRLDDAERALEGTHPEDEAAARTRAGLCYQRGTYADGLRAMHDALRSNPHNRIVRAYLLTALGQLDDAESELAAALEVLDATRQPFARAAALTARGDLARRRRDNGGAREYHDEARALYRRLGNVRNTASASLNLGVTLKDLGLFDEAREALRQARALAERVEDRASALIADANLGIAQLASGDSRSAVERFERVIPALRDLGIRHSDLLLRALLARAYASAGDDERARATIQDVESDVASTDNPRVQNELDTARELLHARLEAAATADEGESEMNPPSGSLPQSVFRTFLAINRRLASERDLDRAMGYLLETAETVTGARASYLLVERDQTVRLELASRIGPEEERAFSRSIANRAISQQRTMTSEDAMADRDLMSMPSVLDLRLRSALCVPFHASSGVRGALYVEHPGRSGAFGHREAELLEALADQAAIAVDRMIREEELATALATSQRDLAVAKRTLNRHKASQLIGASPPIEEMRRQITRYARSDLAVLVQGETGTGKELVARMLHDQSRRSSGTFVSENCSAIPPELMESELFGHMKGTFTGADQDRAGLLELASGGTLFLDEVGDMPAEMQAKLLRALQEGVIRRLGGRETIPIDVRLITATHKDLRSLVETKEFREDLYFRVAAGVLRVPPLRERGEDIALLARHFVQRMNAEHGRHVTIRDETIKRLMRGAFPGNVRELEHVLARAYLLTEGDVLDLDEDVAASSAGGGGTGDQPWPAIPLVEATYRTIHAALRSTGGDKTAAAKLLGISRTALYEKLRREEEERPVA
ncbi:MAG: hypothetical protein RL562_149 [Planctomycetota bacterium]